MKSHHDDGCINDGSEPIFISDILSAAYNKASAVASDAYDAVSTVASKVADKAYDAAAVGASMVGAVLEAGVVLATTTTGVAAKGVGYGVEAVGSAVEFSGRGVKNAGKGLNKHGTHMMGMFDKPKSIEHGEHVHADHKHSFSNK